MRHWRMWICWNQTQQTTEKLCSTLVSNHSGWNQRRRKWAVCDVAGVSNTGAEKIFCPLIEYLDQGFIMTSSVMEPLGNCMKEGEDYEDAFSPVPHTTSGRIIISLAAANELELHSCDLSQAFIQAGKLDEGINRLIFIRPLQGATEDEDIVYEVCKQQYSIPSSARALHITLSKWFKEQGFARAGFEDSVWVREAGGKYAHQLVVSGSVPTAPNEWRWMFRG
eukprot:3937720-Rhodomonas_salina.2